MIEMKKNLSLKDWIPVVDGIYKHGDSQDFMICPHCQEKRVKVTYIVPPNPRPSY